jgi:hypothetical protein
MINKQPIKLEVGDQLGFFQLAQDIDSNDRVVFFPIVEVTERDGERAYRYQYPDGQISRGAIKESNLDNYSIKINRAEVVPAPQIPNLAICLSDRQDEFTEAFKRGMTNDFEIFDGWDADTFFVVNRTNNSEYRIEFETIHGKTYAECNCPDFCFRRRICKHLSFAFVEIFFKKILA